MTRSRHHDGDPGRCDLSAQLRQAEDPFVAKGKRNIYSMLLGESV